VPTLQTVGYGHPRHTALPRIGKASSLDPRNRNSWVVRNTD
jgi:hypothetical protein